MQRNFKPERCYGDLTQEQLAKWRLQQAKIGSGLYAPFNAPSKDLLARIANFEIRQHGKIEILLHFKDSLRLTGEMHSDSKLLNAVSYVLNVMRSAGLIDKAPLTVFDEGTPARAYSGVQLNYDNTVASPQQFHSTKPAQDAKLILLATGFKIQLPLTAANLLESFSKILGSMNIQPTLPLIANEMRARL